MGNSLDLEKTSNTQPIQCHLIFNLGLFSKQDRHMVEFWKFGKHSVAIGNGLQTWKTSDIPSIKESVNAVQNDRDQAQIIFLRQRNSYAALDVSKEMVEAIINGHGVDPGIWNILFSFRTRKNDLEETYSYSMYKPRARMDASFEFAYLFKFADCKGVGESTQWINRQFGIYQQYHKEQNRNVFILVLPSYDSATFGLQGHIEGSASIRERVLENPIYFHLALFLEYLNKFRLCLAEYERRLECIADDVFTFEIKDVLPFADMYENLQSLRVIERKLAPFPAIFCGHRNLLYKLSQINSSLLENAAVSKQQSDANTGTIESLHESTSAYERETDYMLGRVRSTSQLISDTIALKSQNTSEVMSNQMLRDSGTIRVITLVTMIYLPATFVAGFFGMGFFSTQDGGTGHDWVSSPYLGVYFAVAVPLTLLTLIYWKWMEQRKRKTAQLEEADSPNV